MTEEEGYHGPATLVAGESEVDVTVRLRGQFEPIDGRYHWYGRIEVNPELNTLLGGRSRAAVLRTPHGEAAGQLSDPDTWGRYRVSGTGWPPFPVATSLEDVESR